MLDASWFLHGYVCKHGSIADYIFHYALRVILISFIELFIFPYVYDAESYD
jgi:hypothetical protein